MNGAAYSPRQPGRPWLKLAGAGLAGAAALAGWFVALGGGAAVIALAIGGA